MKECVFAPYFSYDQAASHFAAVHKVFGASNVSKMLLHLPVNFRSDAAITIAYQALARMQDPAYGCVAYIMALQQQVQALSLPASLPCKISLRMKVCFDLTTREKPCHPCVTGRQHTTGD
ncbi:LOB domain-containing protein 33 [Linum perenne]